MRRWVACAVIWPVSLLLGAQADEGPEGLLTRIRARMKQNLSRVPDYTCLQSVERWYRDSANDKLEPRDTLRLEVGFVGGKEIFAWQGAKKFEEKELSEMIGAGTVGTGSFAIHASNVFLSDAPKYTYKGQETIEGRPAVRYDYEVPQELSRYRIRVPAAQAVVGFHGSFWVDAKTLDLIRLEVHSEDIPPALGLASTSDVMDYSLVKIGESAFLLPKSSELAMVGVYGNESRNRREITGCHQYAGEASLSFDESTTVASAPSQKSSAFRLPPDLPVELSLDSEIDPESAALGDPIRAVLVRPLVHNDRVLAPQGAVVSGRLVRLERNSVPIPHYVVGLQFDTIEFEGVQAPFLATMEDAGPASGLIRQAKRLDPTFTRRRSPRLEILVREKQPGQGLLHWKAQQHRIPRGLRMRWRTEP